MLPEFSFSDRWSRGRKLWERDWMAADSSSELGTFHKAMEFSLKKLGKPKLEMKREQYNAIRAICFER